MPHESQQILTDIRELALVYKFTTQRYTHHMTPNPNPNPKPYVMHGVIDRAHARSSYTNSGYLPCARPFSYTMVNYRATDQCRPNVSDDDESTG